MAAAKSWRKSLRPYPHAKTEKKATNLGVAAKWTFGIAETYDDCLIDKDEQYPKEKLAEP
jgi:hypothetical protein